MYLKIAGHFLGKKTSLLITGYLKHKTKPFEYEATTKVKEVHLLKSGDFLSFSR